MSDVGFLFLGSAMASWLAVVVLCPIPKDIATPEDVRTCLVVNGSIFTALTVVVFLAAHLQVAWQ